MYSTNNYYPNPNMIPVQQSATPTPFINNPNPYLNGYYGNGTVGQQPIQASGVQINSMPNVGSATTTEEDRELLKSQKGSLFQFTELDKARGRCNHRDGNNNYALVVIGGGNGEATEVECKICGAKFHLVDTSIEAVNEYCKMFLDLFQTMKTMWINPPHEFAEAVFECQAILEKLPDMYKVSNISYESAMKQISNIIQSAGYQGNQMVSYLQNTPNPMTTMGGGMMYPQPQYQQMNPMMGQQPMYGYQNVAQPMGGTMMGGGSAFYQNGVTPQPVVQQPIQPVVQQQTQQPVVQNPQQATTADTTSTLKPVGGANPQKISTTNAKL